MVKTVVQWADLKVIHKDCFTKLEVFYHTPKGSPNCPQQKLAIGVELIALIRHMRGTILVKLDTVHDDAAQHISAMGF